MKVCWFMESFSSILITRWRIRPRFKPQESTSSGSLLVSRTVQR